MRRRVVIICILGLAIGTCYGIIKRSYAVSRALSAQMKHGPGTIVDFAEVAPFAWDRVFVFGPYTPHNRIHARIGFHWQDVESTSIDWNESVNLVVFVRGKEVVHWFEHPRNEELEGLANPTGFARQQAQFAVIRVGVEERLALVPPKQ